MGTLQVYLDPFFDALLYCVLGTPGSTEFVLIESVNWEGGWCSTFAVKEGVFQRQFKKKAVDFPFQSNH